MCPVYRFDLWYVAIFGDMAEKRFLTVIFSDTLTKYRTFSRKVEIYECLDKKRVFQNDSKIT